MPAYQTCERERGMKTKKRKISIKKEKWCEHNTQKWIENQQINKLECHLMCWLSMNVQWTVCNSVCLRFVHSFGCPNIKSTASGGRCLYFYLKIASTFRFGCLPACLWSWTVKWLRLRSPLNVEAFNGSVHTHLTLDTVQKRCELLVCSQHFWIIRKTVLRNELSTEVNGAFSVKTSSIANPHRIWCFFHSLFLSLRFSWIIWYPLQFYRNSFLSQIDTSSHFYCLDRNANRPHFQWFKFLKIFRIATWIF